MKVWIIFRMFKIWTRLGIRLFGMPYVLEFTQQGRIMSISFSASLEQAQRTKHILENLDRYTNMERELKAAQNQISELEANIKPEKRAKKK